MTSSVAALQKRLLKSQDVPIQVSSEVLAELDASEKFEAKYVSINKSMNCLLNSGARVLFTDYEAIVTDRFIANELSYQFANYVKRIA